jgi:hypothetical protein
MEAVDFAGFYTGAHEPGCVSVILSEVTAIGVIVRVFESDQTIMVEEPVPGLKCVRDDDRFGMTSGACSVVLLLGKVTPAAC